MTTRAARRPSSTIVLWFGGVSSLRGVAAVDEPLQLPPPTRMRTHFRSFTNSLRYQVSCCYCTLRKLPLPKRKRETPSLATAQMLTPVWSL